MGVDAAGSGEHLPFCLLSRKPEPGEGLLRGKVPGLPADLQAPGKVRPQGQSAALEGEEIHVLMAAVVLPVHKPRLGCHGYLVQRGLLGQPGSKQAVPPVHSLGQDLLCPLLKLGHAVGPASGAACRCRSADQAPPGGLSLELLPSRGQHIHIVQAAQRGALLQLPGQLFDLGGGGVHNQNGLAARIFPNDLFVQHQDPVYPEHPLQVLQANVKAPADQGRVLNGSGDVHGKGNQGLLKFLQQLPLPICPPLPGIQHFGQ